MQDNNEEAVGRLAVERGLISQKQFEDAVEALRVARSMGAKYQNVSLGEFMVEMRLVTHRQLDALQTQPQQEPAAAAEPRGSELIPGYEFLREVGEGSMGDVYLARQISMDRLVAIKILPRRYSRDSEFIGRFRLEAQLSAKLDHVNVVRGLTVDEHMGRHYFVMEYVDGESLEKIIHKEKILDEERALSIVMQVGRALAAAHEKGIFHRDIKPGNILVTGDDVAKVCDMGLAKVVGTESFRTTTGVMIGTPHYVSPEQARGEEDIDARTDIYSLGATLYHCVTGSTPFHGSSVAAILTKRLTEEIPWPQDVNPDVTEGCCRIIEKMMAKDREDRYPSMKEVFKDMEAIIDGKEPETVKLSEGKSSVAPTGVMDTVKTPAPPAPRKRKISRKPRLEPPAPTPAPEPSGTPAWKIWGGVAAGVLAVVLIAVIAGSRGKKPDAAATPAQEQEAPVEAVQPKDDLKKLQESFEYAQTWEMEHPNDHEGALEKYRVLRDHAKGTVWELKALDALRNVARRKAAVAAASANRPEEKRPEEPVPGPAAEAEKKEPERPAAPEVKPVPVPADPTERAMAVLADEMKKIEKARKKAKERFARNIGDDMKLYTVKGLRTGKMTGFKDDVIELTVDIEVDGKKIPMKNEIPLSDLTPQQREELFALPEPDTADGWLAAAVIAMGEEDLDAAGTALEKTGDHALAPRYRKEFEALTARRAELTASDEWNVKLKPLLTGTKLDARSAVAVRDALEGFIADHSGTAFAKTVEKDVKILMDRIESVLGGISAADVKKLFRGRVVSFDPRTAGIEIRYDFSDPNQMNDWMVRKATAIDGTWKIAGGKLSVKATKAGLVLWRGKLENGKVSLTCSASGAAANHFALFVSHGGEAKFGGLAGFVGWGRETMLWADGVGGMQRTSFYTAPNRTYRIEVIRDGTNLEMKLDGASWSNGKGVPDKKGPYVGLGMSAGNISYWNVVIKGAFDRTWLKREIERNRKAETYANGAFRYRTPEGRKEAVKKFGGSDKTELAVEEALTWLAGHQEPAGWWDALKYTAPSAKTWSATIRVGCTGLSLLAFLGAGHTDASPKYGDNVRRAIDCLLAAQKPDGGIYDRLASSASTGYNHAIAGLALAEAYIMTRDPRLAEPLERAIAFAVNVLQKRGSGWKYVPGEIPDMSATMWFVKMLTAARAAGFEVPESAFDGAKAFLKEVVKSDGQATYDSVQTDTRFSMTAASVVARLAMGTPHRDRLLLKGTYRLVTKGKPDWNDAEKFKGIDGDRSFYYWHTATDAMFGIGGAEWKTWNEAMIKTLVPAQRRLGDVEGSWEMKSAIDGIGGRVFTTSIGALILETYYRCRPGWEDR